MTITSQTDLEELRAIGRIVAQVLAAMGAAIEPGMTTRELDDLGRKMLEREGARSAPELAYRFPGATCISVNEEIAHGIPGGRLNAIGAAVERFADKGGYTLIRNLASHGVGGSLHEEPEGISTWADPSDRRIIGEGLVFTIEPFLSMGGEMAAETGDGWTLLADPVAPTVQYEHSLVATKNGPVILTLP